jgi:hypothetical protein
MNGLKIEDLRLKKAAQVGRGWNASLPKLVVALAMIALTSGCVGYGTITRNLAENGAVGRVEMSSPWGPQKFIRSGETTNTVVIDTDGRIIRVGENSMVVIEGGRVLINPQGTLSGTPGARPSVEQQPRMMFVPVLSGGGTVTNAAAQVGSPGSQYGSETNASRSASPHQEGTK